ncbi:uncharacterized protein H6S33_005864 [Morchella sextelata]|uniref:uncharacterized protein n=1 Tax=Morchella sextelata TaxID=1174677 RepID=UPI001D03C914|nr:uncharacterized protein H6S33_005864 [Morchella sextelata]KAH0613978.1 hypothetical protein H6S33_005864 [Morchella sextelata]
MSFRKRNIVINRGPSPHTPTPTPTPPAATAPKPPTPGIRPSPINGQPTTSTGTPSLDALLAGHAGLPLGCSVLIEEPGTTDFGGALLRYYAAEGIVQGHAVTVVGAPEAWVRDLPAVTGAEEVGDETGSGGAEKGSGKMKIAWRYERLGGFGSGIGGSRAPPPPAGSSTTTPADTTAPATPFCHTYDLTKRLTLPPTSKLAFIPPPPPTSATPFAHILTQLTTAITTHSPHPHRILLPSLLSPLLYPPSAATPSHLLPFLHALRALLRSHPALTLMASLPLELYPRASGLVRWAEVLADCVVELTPFGHSAKEEGSPQGLVRVWKVPVVGEKGGGVGGAVGRGEDLAFVVTRRRFEIGPYSLPPMEEEEGGKGAKKVDVDF